MEKSNNVNDHSITATQIGDIKSFDVALTNNHERQINTNEEIEQIAKETIRAVKNKMARNIESDHVDKLKLQQTSTQFVKYKPKTTGLDLKTEDHERIIRIQEMPVDPLEPPKNKVIRVPRAPPDPPVTLLSS